MKVVALPAAILVALIVAGLTWALWPNALTQGMQAKSRGDYAAAMERLRPLAESGNADAAFAVGQMIANGQGAERNPGAAVEWFLRAAARKHTGAAVELGDRFANGDGVQSDANQALQWYRRATALGDSTALKRITDLADQGSGAAIFQLGQLYATGEGVPVSKTEAAKRFRQAAARGNPEAKDSLLALVSDNLPEAAFQFGEMVELGQGVPPDLAKAATAYERAAALGHAQAQFRLGELYDKGRGVKRNPQTAAQWYGKAAHQGLTEAQYRYGLMVLQGRGMAKDPAEAAHWLHLAVDSGNAAAIAPLRETAVGGNTEAQYALSTVYAQGKLVPQDNAQSLQWLQKAAAQGMPLAQFDLGYAYNAGAGVPVDKAAAARWYGAATAQGFATAIPKLAQLAAAGEPIAQYHYGHYLVNGGQLPQRASDQTDDLIHAVMRWIKAMRATPLSEGVKLLRQSADAGNADAQFELGTLYTIGKGLPQSAEEAAAWFAKAVAQGHAPPQ